MTAYVHVWDVKHPIFQEPFPVEIRTETIKTPVPYDYREFKGRWHDGKMDVLRIHRTQPPTETIPWGYAIYDDGGLADSPDTELICGGVTGKGPAYYSVMRHGNYLFWGFGAPPRDYTPLGRRLFLNSVRYIARFARDRPLLQKRADSRKCVLHVLELARMEPAFGWMLERDLPPEVLTATGKDLDKIEAWYREHEPYLRARDQGRGLEVDEEAKALATPNDRVESLEKWIGLLGGDREAQARALLGRYAQETGCKTREEWKAWLAGNRDRLFFSDSGGFRFFLKP